MLVGQYREVDHVVVKKMRFIKLLFFSIQISSCALLLLSSGEKAKESKEVSKFRADYVIQVREGETDFDRNEYNEKEEAIRKKYQTDHNSGVEKVAMGLFFLSFFGFALGVHKGGVYWVLLLVNALFFAAPN